MSSKENRAPHQKKQKHENSYLFPPVSVGRAQAEAGAERDGGAAGAGASCGK